MKKYLPEYLPNGPETIQIVSLNKGTTTTLPKLIPKKATKRQIQKLLNDGIGKIPGMPGYTVTIAVQNGAATAGVRCRDEDILTSGIALQPGEAETLWVWMIDFRAYLLGRYATDRDFTQFPKPKNFPWIAELIHPEIGSLNKATVAKLSEFFSHVTFVLAELRDDNCQT